MTAVSELFVNEAFIERGEDVLEGDRIAIFAVGDRVFDFIDDGVGAVEEVAHQEGDEVIALLEVVLVVALVINVGDFLRADTEEAAFLIGVFGMEVEVAWVIDVVPGAWGVIEGHHAVTVLIVVLASAVNA